MEFVVVLQVFFSKSMNTAISSTSIRARLSAVIFPSPDSCSKRPLRASNSSRRDYLLTLATRASKGGYSRASTAINPAKTAERSTGGIAA